jgi:SHOCT-like domain
MGDDTRRVLELVAQGKVTVDEGEQLLSALNAPIVAPDAPEGVSRPKPRWVRIAIHKKAKEGKRDKDVNIRVPIAVIKGGMRLGALIPGLAGEELSAKMRDRGLDIDFSKLDAASIEAVLEEIGETNIEIESGKAHVRITTE